MYRLGWHFDFHSHKNIRINHDPDVAGMARALRECGVEEIITFAKGHDGFAYYPSKIGTPHPRMKGDPFGDVVKACKAEGVRVLAYVSFGIDGEAGRKHNQWAQVHAGGPHITEDWFVEVCPFTPYLEDLLLPQIGEILAAYPVDGFLFDTMGAMGVCYCDWCQRAFRERHGMAIPRDTDDPSWGLYGQFRHERALNVVARTSTFIVRRKPAAKVEFNWIGTVRYPERMPEGISCLLCDFTTRGPQSLRSSFHAAYGSTANLPCDVMNTIFNQGWGDWSPRPLAGLEQEAVAVWARKCRPYLGDRLHPGNRLDPISVRALRFMAGVQEEVAEQYPAAESNLVPEILALCGPPAIYGEDMRGFALDRLSVRPLIGAHRLLLDSGANFAIVAECFLENHLTGSKLLVLPEMPAIEVASESLLRNYVETGGRLLIVGRVPNVNGEPLDWLGVMPENKVWQDHIYLPLWAESEDGSPVLVHGDFHKLKLDGAEAILPAIRPYDCDYGMRFGHGTGPASDKPSAFAALTRHCVGKGQVWYLEASICSDYAEHANWTQFAWWRGLLNRLVPEPIARVVSPSGSVEIVTHVSEETTWAFLINHGGEQLNGGLDFSVRGARTFAPVPPFPVTLEIRDPFGRKPDAVTTKGEPLPWAPNKGAVEIPMTMDRFWRVVRVDWKAPA